MESLRDKVAIVTGGSRGIGLAIGQALVAEGVHTSVTGRDERHLARARGILQGAGPAAVETFVADVRRYSDVERTVAATVSRFGRLDIVVNNAGVGFFTNVADMTPEQ